MIAVVLAFAAASHSLGAQSGYDSFQKALAAERADGNLQEAIQPLCPGREGIRQR